jgi:hypothetical protein
MVPASSGVSLGFLRNSGAEELGLLLAKVFSEALVPARWKRARSQKA